MYNSVMNTIHEQDTKAPFIAQDYLAAMPTQCVQDALPVLLAKLMKASHGEHADLSLPRNAQTSQAWPESFTTASFKNPLPRKKVAANDIFRRVCCEIAFVEGPDHNCFPEYGSALPVM